MINQLEIRKPDDFHLHLRDGALLETVLPATYKHFARALVMPNLDPPITTVAAAERYHKQIIDLLPPNCNFKPLMTLYLTEKTSPKDITEAQRSGIIKAVKLYPAGATTNSASGVCNINKIRPVLDAMEEENIPLCVHGEVTNPEIDIYDRENQFVDNVMYWLCQWNRHLRIVLEHITTDYAAEFVNSHQPNLAATITIHHLILNRTHMFEGGLRPHRYCLPVAKRDEERKRLINRATSGKPCFFLGTDSAPHLNSAKLSSCGCAGIYSAPMALACLAQLFDDNDAIKRLEHFASINGSQFYNLPMNTETCSLIKRSDPISPPKNPQVGTEEIEVFDPGFPIYWEVAG